MFCMDKSYSIPVDLSKAVSNAEHVEKTQQPPENP